MARNKTVVGKMLDWSGLDALMTAHFGWEPPGSTSVGVKPTPDGVRSATEDAPLSLRQQDAQAQADFEALAHRQRHPPEGRRPDLDGDFDWEGEKQRWGDRARNSTPYKEAELKALKLDVSLSEAKRKKARLDELDRAEAEAKKLAEATPRSVGAQSTKLSAPRGIKSFELEGEARRQREDKIEQETYGPGGIDLQGLEVTPYRSRSPRMKPQPIDPKAIDGLNRSLMRRFSPEQTPTDDELFDLPGEQ